jgi:hypothetical protein
MKTLAVFFTAGQFAPAALIQPGAIMEIKIECACGQPFEFDVELVNSQMPCEVNCPSCGAAATARANVLIRQQLAPRPVAAMVQPATAPSALSPPHVAPAQTLPPPRMAAPVRRAAKPKSPEAVAFRNGVIGAAACAAVGMIGWFTLIYFAQIEIGWAAWGVGALTGLGARMFGGEGGSTLGGLCALFAAIAIIGGHALGTDLTHFSPFIILFLFLGVASAYKIGASGD